MSVPPPIPGPSTDPAPKAPPAAIQTLDEKSGIVGEGVGVGYRAFNRFSHSRASLLAAGTTYYIFFAMFSIVALAYGITAALGAEQIADYVTEALNEAFPGLLEPAGVDAQQLRSVGQASSVVGIVGLLYGGAGAVVAARRALHLIYGAPRDPRNFVVARVRALGWLFVLGPLILLSFVASTVLTAFSNDVLDALNLDWSGPGFLLALLSIALTLGVNFLIVFLLITYLGGIKPQLRARLIGAGIGAIAIEILKFAMALILRLSLDKPQYGALAAPIGILLVLYLQCTTLYGCAAITAGVAEKDVPLADLEPAVPENRDAV
jgi:membrane protein